ncbi:MAG: UbiD family decarboxylase [Desulfurococcales archaeon]|nr:UbiD family decarboxylase [Desulfurococcales archaeon]
MCQAYYAVGVRLVGMAVEGLYLADPLRDLRSYIEWLEEREALVRVGEELSPVLEIPAFLRRVMYRRGPAVLFEAVKGYRGWRVAGNLFPSLELFKEALGVGRLEDVGERLTGLMGRGPPMGLMDKLRGLLDAGSLAKMLPGRTGRARFTSNVVEASAGPLEMLPAFKTWPLDGGRYLTFPLVVTRDPVDGVYNFGVYRVMIVDGSRAVIHWQIHKRGAKAYFDSSDKLPVAIVLGSDPGTLFTGVAPVPHPMDKYFFAGIVRGRGLELYELPSGLMVPANAEVVIEGYVRRGELAEEGPFGDHWGYYDKPVEKYPVFHVERMYYRDDPIYYGSVVGMPPLEDAVIGKAVERVFLPIIKMLLPEVVDMDFPVYGVFQGLLVVSIRKRYPGHAKKVMSALWGLGQTSLTKIIIVVDEDIDVHDINQVIWAVSSHVNPERDVVILQHAHTDALDPAMTAPGLGSKLGIDATRKLPEENNGREWPRQVEEDPAVSSRIEELVDKYLPRTQA